MICLFQFVHRFDFASFQKLWIWWSGHLTLRSFVIVLSAFVSFHLLPHSGKRSKWCQLLLWLILILDCCFWGCQGLSSKSCRWWCRGTLWRCQWAFLGRLSLIFLLETSWCLRLELMKWYQESQKKARWYLAMIFAQIFAETSVWWAH